MNPTLYLSPKYSKVFPNTPVKFTTQGSISSDGSALSYTWSVSIPIGSEKDNVIISDNGETCTIETDVVGVYKVTVTATDTSLRTSTEQASILVTPSYFSTSRVKADPSSIKSAVSSFWTHFSSKEVISSLWGEYYKVLGSDLKRIAETSLSKSIATIPEYTSATNIIVDPKLYIEDKSFFKFSDGFYGNTATTDFSTITIKGIIISPNTLVLTDGNAVVTDNARISIGSSEYVVRFIKDSRIVITTAFAATSIKATRSDAILIAGSDIVSTVTPNTVSTGDIVYIGGAYLNVLQTPVDNPALSSNSFVVDKVFSRNSSGVSIVIYSPEALTISNQDTGVTDTLFISANELGGVNKYTISTETRDIEILSSSQIRISGARVYPVNSQIRISSGKYADTFVKVTSVGFNNVYTVHPKIDDYITEATTARAIVTTPNMLSGMLLTADGITSAIQKVSYIRAFNGEYVAAVKCTSSRLLHKKTNISWKIANTLTLNSDVDIKGVSHGDTLRIELSQSLTTNRSYIDCIVLGAYKNIVHFDISSIDTLEDGAYISTHVSTEVFARIFEQLQIPTFYKTRESYVFQGVAKSIIDSISSTAQLVKYFLIESASFIQSEYSTKNTIHITPSTISNTIARVSLRPLYIIRNSIISIEETASIISVPILTEYVYPKETSPYGTGYALAAADSTVIYRDTPEATLVENVNYSIQNSLLSIIYRINKEAGSLLVTLQSAFLQEKRVAPGYILLLDGVQYVIKNVLDSNTIELANTATAKAINPIKIINATGYIQGPAYSSYSYIVLRPGIYSYANPMHNTVFAPECIIDNNIQIQNNFGYAAGYSLSDFYDFNTPTIKYISAVKGLLSAKTSGPSLYNLDIAANILLNLPITETLSEILSITDTSVVLQEIDEASGEYLPYIKRFDIDSTYSAHPFTAYRQNSITNASYAVGDIIPAFSILTGRVFVSDYIKDPRSFIDPLTCSHTWKISIDLLAASSREIGLLYEFVYSLRPVYTKPVIEGVLFLLDTITVEEYLSIDGVLSLLDDTTNLELTHSVDSNNAKGKYLRTFDDGELSTRTLLYGRDLVFDGTHFISARGGFVLDTNDRFPTATGIQNDTKQLEHYLPFTTTLAVRGLYLVAPGDLLFVDSGVNAGVYEITSIQDDNTIAASPISGRLPYYGTPVVSNDNATFSIMRSLDSTIVSSIECQAIDGALASFSGAVFNWDLVTAGDFLIERRSVLNKIEILRVIYDPASEDGSITLELATPPIVGEEYFIYRDSLVSKEYGTGSIVAINGHKVAHDFADDYKIAEGDYLEITSGVDEGLRYKILHIDYSSVYIEEGCSASASDTIKFVKPGRATLDDSDKRLEFLQNYDNVTIMLESIVPVGIPSASYTNSAATVRDVSGIVANPGDLITLLSSGNVIFEGKVLNTAGMCLELFADPSIASIAYDTVITKGSKP